MICLEQSFNTSYKSNNFCKSILLSESK